MMVAEVRVVALALIVVLAGCGGGSGGTTPGEPTAPPAGPSNPGAPVDPGPDPTDPTDPEAPDYWPTTAWQEAAAETQGFVPGALDDLGVHAAADLPELTSLMIVRNGYVVHESYHTPEGLDTTVTADTKHNVWSVTKSISSLTVGAAWQNGLIGADDLDVTTNDFFADTMAGHELTDERRDIRFRDALQMRSGLSWSEQNELITFTVFHLVAIHPACADDDLLTVCSLLQRPLAKSPGTVWNYNTYDSYLLSAFFYHLTNFSLQDYVRDNVFNQIGVDFAEDDWGYWPPNETNQRYTYGGGLSHYRTQDMARVGQLVLHRGQWDGQQLIAPEWFDLSLEPIGDGEVAQFDSNGDLLDVTATTNISYGMQWWTRTGPSFTGLTAITARGLGGQYILVFPEKNLVIAATHAFDLSTTPVDRTSGLVSFLQSRVLDSIAD